MNFRLPSISFLFYCTVIATSFLMGRFLFFPVRKTYFFLEWNLLLAWVPFCLAYYLLHRNILGEFKKHPVMFCSLFFLLFIFFPNSLYIVTDFIHLTVRKDITPSWLDFLLIGVFAWTGIMLGFYSLSMMQNFIFKLFGKIESWFFAILMILLSSFGIYLGRELRWNSWDLFLSPWNLARDVLALFSHPVKHFEVWLFCSGLSLSFILSYLIFLAVTQWKKQNQKVENLYLKVLKALEK